ncbi:hypothetical protein RJ639_034694 [Escallonia herrerae]|uniref:Malectin-like domain-containing protein n=1 Tax=Escallonia herrerae TaxID=1293975 RepID=A0AA89BF79_9ASTE|nr:hypothetical protein RJ639_034694 [Escallonia herrerae]
MATTTVFLVLQRSISRLTVNTSSNGGGPVYHEAIYVTHGSGCIKVCLLQTQEREVPFISSVEVVLLWVNLYSQMETNATFHLVTRTNLGGEEIRFAGALSDEKYNRIWTKGTTPSNCSVDEIVPDFVSETENDPPLSVLLNSIHSVTSDAIILTVNLSHLTPRPAYFVFYLTESVLVNPSDTTIVQIMINGGDQKMVAAPDAGKCRVVTIYPLMVAGPTINITLAPVNRSSLPPLIVAIEVFLQILFQIFIRVRFLKHPIVEPVVKIKVVLIPNNFLFMTFCKP